MQLYQMNVEIESARARVTFIWCADLLPTAEHPNTLPVPAWILTGVEGSTRAALVPRLWTQHDSFASRRCCSLRLREEHE